MNGSQSLSHTRWNCKYHIVVAPKFRRQAICIKLKEDTGKILGCLTVVFVLLFLVIFCSSHGFIW